MLQDSLLSRLPLLFVAFTLCRSTARSDEQILPKSVQQSSLPEIVKRLQDSKLTTTASGTIGDRIRESTWRLLAGEAASSSDVKMFSTGVDATAAGLAQLKAINEEIEANEAMQREVAANPQLAMRLDLALESRQKSEKDLALSREEELLRLHQLRQINREYRALIEDLLASQTEILRGDMDALNARLKSATEHLKQVEGVVAGRQDFYLFEDEPNVEADPGTELELITSLARPYSDSTIQHEQIVSAHAQLQAALSSNPVDLSGLQVCLKLLSEFAPDEVKGNELFHLIRGVANMELASLIVGDRPWDLDVHTEAAPHIAEAKLSLKEAVDLLPDDPIHRVQRDAIKFRQSVLEDPDWIMSHAVQLAKQEKSRQEALALLNKGVQIHASPQMFLAWVSLRWENGELNGDNTVKLVKQAEDSTLLNAADEQVILTKSRIAVLDSWKHFQNHEPAIQELQSLTDAKISLGAMLASTDPESRLVASSLMALTDVMLLLADNSTVADAAKQTFMQIGATAAELEARVNQAEPEAQPRLASAAAIARLAEGYLAVRFAEPDSNRAQLAFAAAAALSDPHDGLTFTPSPDAAVLLRTMLMREDAANLRLAMSERQLRKALQTSFPAVISSTMGPSARTSSSLVRYTQDLRASVNGNVSPSSQLDSRDTEDSRNAVLSDSASVAAFSLITEKRSSEALTLLLQVMEFQVDSNKGLSDVSWSDALQKLRERSDPLISCAFAESLEQYAAEELDSGNPQKSTLLRNALEIQQQLERKLNSESIWEERWPFLKTRVQNTILRLTDASHFLTKANALRAGMELSAARKVLQDGSARFPENSELRIAFVQTLMDESELNSTDRDNLLKAGLKALSGVQSEELSAAALINAAKIYEQLGDSSAAVAAYQKAIVKASSAEDSLIARSRISSLRLSAANN